MVLQRYAKSTKKSIRLLFVDNFFSFAKRGGADARWNTPAHNSKYRWYDTCKYAFA